MEAITEQRLSLVHPLLREKITRVIQNMAARGIACRVTQGLRTWEEQAAIYAQGRTAPGKIVTNARPGYSSHNFGLAVDLVPSTNGLQTFVPDWAGDSLRYRVMQQFARDEGLICGCDWHSFPDPPHFQLAGAPVTPTVVMRALYSEKGMQAVWNIVKA